MEDVRQRLNKLVKKKKTERISPTKIYGRAGSSYASAAAKPSSAIGSDPDKRDTSWYWDARRCLRFFPIAGNTKEELVKGLDDFVLSKLRVPSGVLSSDDIGFVRRARATKRSKIKDEIVVQFASVDARDLVYSHAKNLAEWIDKDRRPLAGIRMEIPERLLGEHKTLEMYGHNLVEA